MVTRAYAALKGTSPVQTFPRGKAGHSAGLDAVDITGKCGDSRSSSTPSTSKKPPRPQSMVTADETAKKLDMQPEPTSIAAAPSPTASAAAESAGDLHKTIRKRKPPSSQPTAKKPRAAPKAPKVRVGPARSTLVKALKKAIRGVQFLATDLAAFELASDDQWGAVQTVRAAAPMPADVARALFLSSVGPPGGGGADLPAAGGPAWETRLLGDSALRALGVRSASLRGNLFAPPGMQLPARQLHCWAVPRDEASALLDRVISRMMRDAGLPSRGPRGGVVVGKPRRIGATTLILQDLAVTPKPPPFLSQYPLPPLPFPPRRHWPACRAGELRGGDGVGGGAAGAGLPDGRGPPVLRRRLRQRRIRLLRQRRRQRRRLLSRRRPSPANAAFPRRPGRGDRAWLRCGGAVHPHARARAGNRGPVRIRPGVRTVGWPRCGCHVLT